MTGFSDPIIGGGGALVYPAIRSPGYVPGVSGWSIRKDGSAEFDDVTVRGTFAGIDSEITSAGVFFYSGPPALGNLIFALVNSAGTDAYGNVYNTIMNVGVWSPAGAMLEHFGLDPAGQVYIVGGDGATRVFISNNPVYVNFFNDFGAVVTLIDPTNSAIWQYEDLGSAAQGQLIFAQAGKAGIADPNTGQPVQLGLNLGMPGAGNTASIVGAASAPQLITSASGSSAGFAAYLGGAGAADTTAYTITGTAYEQLGEFRAYAAGDAQPGTIYRFTAIGHGIAGNPVENLALEFTGAQAFCYAFPGVAAANGFTFKIVAEVVVETTGPAGTAHYHIQATMGPASSGGLTLQGFTPSGAFDTSAGGTLGIFAAWAAASAGETITCDASYWERLGP